MGITATTRTGNSFIGTPIDGLGKKMQCTPEAVNGRQPARIHEIKMCFASVFRYNRSRSSSLMDLPRKLSTVYSRSRQGASEPFRRRLPRILVVDDNPNTMSLMQDLLASRGYDVAAVPDAAQAEAEILRHAPDLVLSDVVMPGKSGYELCRELKENPATRLVPFVLITGLSEREDRVRGIEAGADDFLNKPIFPEELFARVKSLLKLKEFTDELETAESVLCTLGLSVESRDPYTEGHCERLAENASNLGRHLHLDEEEIIALRRGGYLHDLGKIAVPDEILKKGANLTAEEWQVMKRHPLTGENICRPLRSLRLVLPIIRNHHEHFNGSGYPDGLQGPDIPVLARILQVVDVYDALRTARPYKPALSHDQAAITMREEGRSGLWDEELVAEFFQMLEKQRQVA
ncbi:MAG: metal-dependent phosphohydrolase [Acidobacteria bacterium]|nr:MAG: metal-dependent phosphohydrolase [Acidobacteriota bacterium]PYV62281.1 MAG: metal-dependent phosphohydrolase [Acidobacteriota bacterium]